MALVLSLSVEREGLDFCLQQVEAVLLACGSQGFAGPLVLLLLHAATNLRLQAEDHPTRKPHHPGLPLPSVMELVQHLVPLSLVLDGTPAATLDALQASCYWWAATSCTGTSNCALLIAVYHFSILVQMNLPCPSCVNLRAAFRMGPDRAAFLSGPSSHGTQGSVNKHVHYAHGDKFIL